MMFIDRTISCTYSTNFWDAQNFFVFYKICFFFLWANMMFIDRTISCTYSLLGGVLSSGRPISGHQFIALTLPRLTIHVRC